MDFPGNFIESVKILSSLSYLLILAKAARHASTAFVLHSKVLYKRIISEF